MTGPDSVGVTVKDQMESVKAGSAAFFQKARMCTGSAT